MLLKNFVTKLNKAIGNNEQLTWKKNIAKVADISKTGQDFATIRCAFLRTAAKILYLYKNYF